MRIPQYLHRPLVVLWWESDEFALFASGIVLWYLFGGYILLLTGLVIPIVYSKVKKRYPRGFFNHLAYYSGFASFRGYPDFFVKDFYE